MTSTEKNAKINAEQNEEQTESGKLPLTDEDVENVAGGGSKRTVKWFNNDKGFGYIEDTEAVEELLNYSGLDMKEFKGLEAQNQ